MKKIILVIILILLFTLFLSADIYVRNMELTKEFNLMGRKSPEKIEIKEMWLGLNKFAQLGKEISIIVNHDKEKLYFIVHKQKIYYELPTDINREELLNIISSLSPKAAEVIKSIKITDVKMNLGGETKQIANWNCHSTEFEMVLMIPALNMMPKFRMRMWATKDLPYDYNKFSRAAEEFFVKYFLEMLDMDESSKNELEKMHPREDFQVATEVTIKIFGTEINVESQSLEVTEKPAPSGVYSPPAGYTKKALRFP